LQGDVIIGYKELGWALKNVMGVTMILRSLVRFGYAFTCLVISGTSLAWGPLGHQEVAKIAAKVAKEKYKNNELSSAFLSNLESLAALALVPDSQWKNGQPPEVMASLNPAHFLDIEFISPTTIEPSALPFKVGDATSLIMKNCRESGLSEKLDCSAKISVDKILDAAGSVPWRIGQISDLLVTTFKTIKELQSKNAPKTEIEAQMKNVLVYSGILAHYIGDLTQPLHITKNYDGGDTGQKGIHAFFETKLIDAQPHGFDKQAFDYAMNANAANALLKAAADKSSKISLKKWMPVEWSFVVALDSNEIMESVLKLDRDVAIVTKNRKLADSFASDSNYGLDVLTSRRSPNEVASEFNEVLTQRVGLAADFLALLWDRAWVEGGSPKLSKYTPAEGKGKIGKIEPILLDYSKFM
jgi:hypothetical protein